GTTKVRAVPVRSGPVGVDCLDRIKIESQDDLNEEIGTWHALARPKVGSEGRVTSHPRPELSIGHLACAHESSMVDLQSTGNPASLRKRYRVKGVQHEDLSRGRLRRVVALLRSVRRVGRRRFG